MADKIHVSFTSRGVFRLFLAKLLGNRTFWITAEYRQPKRQISKVLYRRLLTFQSAETSAHPSVHGIMQIYFHRFLVKSSLLRRPLFANHLHSFGSLVCFPQMDFALLIVAIIIFNVNPLFPSFLNDLFSSQGERMKEHLLSSL